MADIDFTAYPTWNRNLYNSEAAAFTGVLDGNGHTIKGMPSTINTSSNVYGTFFIYNKGTLKNFTLDLGEMTNQCRKKVVGPLCAFNLGVISGVTVKGTVNYSRTNGSVAMICGTNQGGRIMNCHTEGSLTSGSKVAGIAVTVTDNGVIENCYNAADITATGTDENGAFAITAENTEDGSVIRNCYNKGVLTENSTQVEKLGLDDGLMENCYHSNEREDFDANKLGEAFAEDLENEPLNDGWPVLLHEITGDFPHVEGPEDIKTASIKSISDTSVIFNTDTVFEYYKPRALDFMIKVTTESGTAAFIAPEALNWGKKSNNRTLTIQSIKDSRTEKGEKILSNKDQEVIVSLLVGENEVARADYEIPASDRWSDYAEQPEKISSNDERYGEKYRGYYKITCPEELAWIARELADESSDTYQIDFKENVMLANDIDMNDTSDPAWMKGDGLMYWDIPIGYFPSYGFRTFRGKFDGCGHTIRGMYFDPEVAVSSCRNITSGGLFGAISLGAEIKNLAVKDSYVAGSSKVSTVGGICGGMLREGGIIRNCSFDGEVRNALYAAGIVGRIQSSTNEYEISGCSNAGKISVTGADQYAAGIIAYCSGKTSILNCYNAGSVKNGANNNAAGIVATVQDSQQNPPVITNSYNAGSCTYSISPVDVPLNNVFAVEGTGAVSEDVEIVTKKEAKDGTLLGYLEDEVFVADDENINGGYPILKWQSPLVIAKASYPDELDYYADLDKYSKNGDQVRKIIADAKENIAKAASFGEAEKIMNDAKAAIDAVPDDDSFMKAMQEAIEALKAQLEEAEKRYAFGASTIALENDAFVFTGEAIEPAVVAADKDGKPMVKDTDYEVAYEANVEPGIAKVTVTGKGGFIGTRVLLFQIAPKMNKITSLKKAKKAFTVKWTKEDSAAGYQISYSLKKNFSGAKTYKIADGKTVSKKVTKLKAKRIYYVRVRTFIITDGQTIYGAWSPVKSVKTK